MTSTTDSMKLQRMKTLMNFHNHTSQEPSSSVKDPKRCTRSTSPSLSFFALRKRKCTIDVEPGAKNTKGDIEMVCTPTQGPAFLKYACISPSQAPSKKDLSPPLFSSSFPVNMPSPPASSQHSHSRKLKSLVISSDLNALLNYEENPERYTNRPPSPLSDEANITPESSQVAAGTTSRSVHPSFSRSPPISPSLPSCSPTSRPSTSSSPSSSASSNFHTGPFGSLIHGGNHTWGHTPDTSLTSLASIVEGADGEPLLKSLPPPPRPGNKIVPTKVARARPGVVPGPSASLTSRPVVNPDKDSSAAVHWQISRVLAGEDAFATTKTKILDKTSEQHGRPLSASKDSDFKSSKSASPSIQTTQTIPPSYNNSHSLLPLTSYAPLIQNRTPCTSNSSHSAISASSSDSTSTVTPGRLEMEVKSTRPNVRLLPSLPPVAPFSNRAHSIRHSKSAHNLNHHSAPPGTVYASAGDISKRKASRRVKVLSAEDVLGELFRKEDALDSLRILARTGTGITFQEEVPLPVSPSSSRHSRTSAKSRSTQGLEERVGTSFLRMAFEEDDEEGGSDREDATQIHSSDLHTAGISIPTAPRLRPSHSSEVSVMHLNEGHVFEKLHPYSGHYSGSGPARPSASSAKSVLSRSSSSASVLSYAYAPTGDERYSKVLKMGSKSGSTEGYGGNAAAANVVVQGVNNDGVSRRSQYRRQRPARISISPTEDKNGTHSQHPTTANSKALPQLPRLIPPSPLSASFERSLGLSEHIVSEVSSATLVVPASPITSPVTNQILPSAEDFSFRQQRSSFVTIQSGSEESTFSRRPGSISTLAFGNLKSGSGNETYEISLDSDKDSSSSA
ncbi:hypothetical protein F5051DRAFT_484472 [Lentinula edodes]|nr:hypothetical protein F5051DRAFT_484472 [Lentinula edodes]